MLYFDWEVNEILLIGTNLVWFAWKFIRWMTGSGWSRSPNNLPKKKSLNKIMTKISFNHSALTNFLQQLLVLTSIIGCTSFLYPLNLLYTGEIIFLIRRVKKGRQWMQKLPSVKLIIVDRKLVQEEMKGPNCFCLCWNLSESSRP